MSYCALARAILMAALTPLLEKNANKTLALDLPVVFSMTRAIVLAFAVAMLRQVWLAGIAGWPDATLAIAIVLALPLLGALERAKPEQLVSLFRSLIGRFGEGEARTVASAYADHAHEPSKFDDHRDDQ